MLFIPQTRFPNHFRLENKFHKIFSLLSLDQHFGPFSVNRDIKLPSFGRIKNVFFLLKFKAISQQAGLQDRDLLIGQSRGIGDFRHWRL